MKATEILDKIKNHKGQTLTATWESVVPALKAYKGTTVTKRTFAHIIAGVEFQNRKDIKEAIEAGQRGEVGPLPWGHWVNYPFIIAHTRQDGTYNEYVRLYPPTEKQMEYFNLQHTTQFYANGRAISRDEAIQYCGSKAKAAEEPADCFSVNCDSVISIG